MKETILALVVALLSSASCQTTGTSSQCEASRDCKSCISTDSKCVWCSNPSHPEGEPKCVHSSASSVCEGYIINPSSAEEITKDDEFTDPKIDDSEEVIQMRPQVLTVKLRKGQPIKVNVTFRRVVDYPLDLYYVMDLSNSMSDDLETLKRLGADLVNDIRENITNNVRVGFGSFVDKVMMPFTSTAKEHLKNPCYGRANVTQCVPPFGFRHQLQITENATAFETAIEDTQVSGNIDVPEGSFDALMQIAVCERDINWRSGSMRVILLTTDAAPHIAMDGKLASILEANDMKCHLEEVTGTDEKIYAKSQTMDYPSLGQLKRVFTTNKIRTIFAVTKEVFPLYEEIPKVLKELGEVAELASDSNNIVPLIATTYNNIKGRLVVRATDAPSHVTFTQKTYCKSGVINEQAMDCDDINIDDEVIFELSFTANECRDQKDQITLSSSSINDVVKIELEYICDCECEVHDVANSSYCNNHGNVTCGLCTCEEGFQGTKCQCTSDIAGDGNATSLTCQKDGSANDVCEGRGFCDCGTCRCDRGYNGTHCQCETTGCATRNQKLCGGEDKGLCDKCPEKNEAEYCICHNGYSHSPDHTCSCHDKFCTAEGDNEVCSGLGDCECDKCACHDKDQWRGNFCSICQHPKCTGITASCDDPFIKACAECRSKSGSNECTAVCEANHKFLQVFTRANLPTCDCQTGSETVSSECNDCATHDYSITMPEACEGVFSDTCSYHYKIYWTKQDRFAVYVKSYDKDNDCPEPPEPISALAIVLPTVGAVILIGCIALGLWKGYIMWQDKKNYMKFEQYLKQNKAVASDNPLWQRPDDKFENPMYEGIQE